MNIGIDKIKGKDGWRGGGGEGKKGAVHIGRKGGRGGKREECSTFTFSKGAIH